MKKADTLQGVRARAAALLALLTAGCLSNDSATFVGKQVDPRRGRECGLCLEGSSSASASVPVAPTHQAVDCAAQESGLEFLPVTVWDFDGANASNLYSYSDESGLYVPPKDGVHTGTEDGWQPLTEDEERCLGAGKTGVFHYQAGPFTNWGGAFGRNLKCLNGTRIGGERAHGTFKLGDNRSLDSIGCDAADKVEACAKVPGADATAAELATWSACPARDRAMVMAGASADPLTAGAEEFLLGMTLDLSAWDGVSFWARRSPESQAGIRFSMGDKYTSDDLSYLQYHVNPTSQRFCERNIDCGCGGNSRCYVKSVAEGGDDSARCWDLPPSLTDGVTHSECGTPVCQDIYPAFQHEDVQSANTTCRPFTFRGGIEGLYCYSDALPPQENSLLCGDSWSHPVYLSTEWQFFKVPFGTLLQQGWAKKSYHLDLTTANLITFNFGTGWIDVWLDDVRFYRELHNTGGK